MLGEEGKKPPEDKYDAELVQPAPLLGLDGGVERWRALRVPH